MPYKFITLPCHFCGADFQTRNPKQRFCSLRCSKLVPVEVRFWSKVRKTDSCWLWTGSVSNGYGSFRWGEVMGAHRASYILHFGPVPSERKVCHNCPNGDNPLCVNPAHLFLGTHQDNMSDMVAKGRSPRGDRSGARLHPESLVRGEESVSAKLTEVIVREIREMRQQGATTTVLAAQYGVSVPTICDIVNGKKWKHVA